MANHGTDPRTRMRLMRERVLAMKEIWTHHEASFHGEFVDFDRIWCDPKPLQRPHPPIYVGGSGPTVHDRVLEYGDVWMPNHGDDIVDRIGELRERAGRDVPVVVMGPPADVAVLQGYADAGVERVLFWLPSARLPAVLEALERVERVMVELNGG
jgi:alkanesulfonate monooxygenase SsuD/methylene tetrahydromethanopterin reductase-like flavin-dependent oxidoreductase (luciferase family)